MWQSKVNRLTNVMEGNINGPTTIVVVPNASPGPNRKERRTQWSKDRKKK